MHGIAIGWWFAALGVLLAASAFFSIAETSMMAVNRYRLKHLVAQGDRGARRVAEQLKRTDRLLGAILIGNNLVNAAAATLASLIAVHLLGEDKVAYAASTLGVSLLIIVFSEITPKVIGATYPERIAPAVALLLGPLQRVMQPAVWAVNLLVQPLLALFGAGAGRAAEEQRLSPQEIRTLVLESSAFMPKKHASILLNLFDLDDITVQDVMVPRPRIEAIRLDDPIETVVRQLATSYHMRIPVLGGGTGDVRGILHLRKVIGQLQSGSLDRASIEALVAEPYFVPATTPVLAQLQYFQERKERLALVVDEYGELLGLVTVDDIVEEMVGKFTTTLPTTTPALAWGEDGSAAADGSMTVREVNRALGLELPTDGPKTLNGLILEHLQDIPEADVSVRIAGVAMEIVHAQGRAVKSVRIFRPWDTEIEDASGA